MNPQDDVPPADITRRRFSQIAGATLASWVCGPACALGSAPQTGEVARIQARPRTSGTTTAEGTRQLGLGSARDGILQMPAKSVSPLPLAVLLHGAGGSPEALLEYLGPPCREAGVVALAPYSRGSTWDAIRGDFGPDVAFINRALERTFEIVNVDPARIAIGGFSDGATYALSLGLPNGDLFGHILAFSPGFVVGGAPPRGKPKIFVSHGTDDRILPIDRCSRVIVPQLTRLGYDVTFREFTGGHQVPDAIAREGFGRM
jgi:predicted esterase